jgi:hypothetical protein
VSYLSRVPASCDLRALVKACSAATLVGIEPPAARNLELKLYAIATARTDRTVDPPVSNDLDGDLGFHRKYGITRGLVADLTVNTDFAQVEDDEQQVNLTRFNLQYPEKSDFFLEGQGVFGFGNAGLVGGDEGGGPNNTPVLFFSRRIGLSDGGAIPIRAGARLTGRARKFSFGALNIHTGPLASAGVEPTGFSVFRLKRDVFRRSQIGLIATNRSRTSLGGRIEPGLWLRRELRDAGQPGGRRLLRADANPGAFRG